ncbi:MAG: hypothetical protein FJ279_05100 [Planctomycetes bacterium]|nr:hypothetical protein [Planctomycetota bacterium]MBM4083439.1 hypothetical protein [Planctomycetota bacterium]
MVALENSRVRMAFDSHGRLAQLLDARGVARAPIDERALTEAFIVELRNGAGEVIHVSPQRPPRLDRRQEGQAQTLVCTWELDGPWGALTVRTKVTLPADSPVSEWTVDIDNRTACALWQVAYPRVSGLTAFPPADGPDWLAIPFEMGEKVPEAVAFVNNRVKMIDTWARSEYGAYDVEGKGGDIAFSYPGMWAMQFMAYGHPSTGGLYFAAHDPQALYKRFGFYADATDGEHAAMVLKQYPEDRTAAGGRFRSFYPAVIGVYEGDWWRASDIYRAWALKQRWAQRGPTRRRTDIPAWAKELDLWYWNWQFHNVGHPDKVVPAIAYLKERFGAEVAFHWYGCNGEQFGSGWRTPEEYPDNRDIRETLVRGVRQLHSLGVRCIPYINARLWNPNTASFRQADGMKWIATDEHGRPAHKWGALGYTMCPTAPPFHDLIARVTNQMIDGCEMDGAYLDQISSCYSVPCFHRAHGHGPGGHDHWCRGYREMLEKVQADIKRRAPDNVITSESVIECYLDLLDLDLAREISGLKSKVGCPSALPIPMFHSVYHDYHMTYGTVQTFKQTDMPHFRFAEALCLVGGAQLMVSGFFAGDEAKDKFRPHLDYMEALTRAHVAGRKWLNLGVWKPPAALRCDSVEVAYWPDLPPKTGIPVILNGCFELGGELCIVLVNHTAQAREGTLSLDPKAYGLDGAAFELWSLGPGAKKRLVSDSAGALEWRVALPPASAQVLAIVPRR